MLSGPSAGQPAPISELMVAHYRDTMLAHADDPSLGACPRCLRTRCPDWWWAYERLAAAGRLTDLPGAASSGGGVGAPE
ncbi:hypothetical protein ACWDV4_15935 [Micromonospora sp. NPDC003197]